MILGSATPDVETFHKAESKEITKFTLNTRISANQKLPDVYIADMREELQKGNFSIFSEALYNALATTLEAREQTILFLNRRGHASSVICRDCGTTCQCPHCDVSLTHHRFKNGFEQLVCHHCGSNKPMPETCSECGSVSIKSVGIGTQRVEEELKKRFPTARILRADRDTTSRKGSFRDMYNAIKNNEADILIGTQMISKGLDLPNVTLVGVILADVGLHIPDFRAAERGFQLMTQVAGRSGRANKAGQVIIQTYNPEHISIKTASEHNYNDFFTQEIKSRKSLKYPPFNRIIKMKFRHSEQKKCTKEIERVKELLSTLVTDHDIQSAPALIPRKHNKYHWNIFIQGPNPSSILQKLLQKNQLPDGWSIDVDPVVMS